MKFEIKSILTSGVICTAEIECGENDSYELKLGLAVKFAISTKTNLRGASLVGANLRGASLVGANLRDANLWSTIGNKKELHSLHLEKYDICFGFRVMQIGCQRHDIEKWRNFSNEEISKMDSGALEWWEKWKDFIFMAIDNVGDKS